jgi:hypothetical protein
VFGQFKGFKSAHYLYNYNNIPMTAIIEFEDVDCANIAKVNMSSFQFDINSNPLIIDFVREDSNLNSQARASQSFQTLPINVQPQNLQAFHGISN